MRGELPAYVTGKSPVALFDAGSGALPARSGGAAPVSHAPAPLLPRTNGEPGRPPPSRTSIRPVAPSISHERYALPLGTSMADGDDLYARCHCVERVLRVDTTPSHSGVARRAHSRSEWRDELSRAPSGARSAESHVRHR